MTERDLNNAATIHMEECPYFEKDMIASFESSILKLPGYGAYVCRPVDFDVGYFAFWGAS